MMDDFHFIRPWWLLLLVPIAFVLWGIYRRQDSAQAWRKVIAPELLPYLLSGSNRHNHFSPLMLIAIGWIVSVVAVAGPTWRREPAPFADDTAALAIVVRVAPSMKVEDLQPDRLTRATQKIHDLLEARRGAKNALIAYSGSAHIVMPLTTDEGIINTFAQALDPKIMPIEGDVAAAALKLADQALSDNGGGSVLWITDSVAPEQGTGLAQWRKQSPSTLRLLPPLLPGPEFDSLETNSNAAKPKVIPLSADNSDVNSIARSAKFAETRSEEKSNRWEEAGYWLTPLIAVLFLPFFRKGWMTRTASR